jgi:hypothetical protein
MCPGFPSNGWTQLEGRSARGTELFGDGIGPRTANSPQFAYAAHAPPRIRFTEAFVGRKLIWKPWTPLKINIFLWLSFRRRHCTGSSTCMGLMLYLAACRQMCDQAKRSCDHVCTSPSSYQWDGLSRLYSSFVHLASPTSHPLLTHPIVTKEHALDLSLRLVVRLQPESV